MKEIPLPLCRQVQKSLKHKKIITYDIETGSKVGDAFFGPFAAGCAYDGENFTFFTSMRQFLDWSLAFPGYLFLAHNAKGYELNYLLDPIRDLLSEETGWTADTVQQGDCIIQFIITKTEEYTVKQGKNVGEKRTKKTSYRYGDTLPIFVCSLEKMAKTYCPQLLKLKGNINFEKEVFDIKNPLHREYLERDCESLYRCYQALEAMVHEKLGCGLGLTAGSTAMKAFKASIPEGHVYYRHSAEVDAIARQSYKGGMVLPGLTTRPIRDVEVRDVKGAYGFQMLTKEYPVGNGIYTSSYQEGKLGIYRCEVSAPVSLPVGCIAERGSSIYPLGTFKATCTSIDIELGKRHGYYFQIEEGYYWLQTEKVFEVFSEKCQSMEVEMDDKGGLPYKELAKLMRNSLYGKFGSKTTNTKLIICPSNCDIPKDACPKVDPRSGKHIDGLYEVEEEVLCNYMIPSWASFVSAYQRCYLMENVYALYQEGASSVYGDTDSIAAEESAMRRIEARGLLPTTKPGESLRYGTWEYEATGTLIVLAPKVYCLMGSDGKIIKARAKGLPIHGPSLKKSNPELTKFETFLNASKGTRFSYEWITSNSVRSRLLKPGLSIITKRNRKISDLSHSQGWEYDEESGRISPIIRGENKQDVLTT